MGGDDLFPLLKFSVDSILQGKLPPMSIIAALASKVLGYLIIAGASFVKIPQILDVLKAESAFGLNAFSVELEMVGVFVQSAYGHVMNLPFSTFGESVLLLIQNFVLLLLINKYSKLPWYRSVIAVGALLTGISMLSTGQITPKAITTAYNLNNFVFIAARVPQIITNFKNKSTGHLNIITTFMTLGGSAVRVFTSIQENAGAAMVRAYILGVTLNTIIFSQIMFYGSKKKKE